MARHSQTVKVRSGRGSVSGSSSDVTPPNTPTLTVGTATTTTIPLSCSAVTDPVSSAVTEAAPSGVATYKFEGKLSTSSTWTTIQNTSSRTASYSGLTPGTSYDVRVSAFDAAGNQSGFSTSSKTTLSPSANLIVTIDYEDGFTGIGDGPSGPWVAGDDPRLYRSGNEPTPVQASTYGITARRGTGIQRTYLARTLPTTFRTESVLGSGNAQYPGLGEFVKGTEYWMGISVYPDSTLFPNYYPSAGRSSGIVWQFHDRAGTILPLIVYHNVGGVWQIQNQTYGNRTGGNGNLINFTTTQPILYDQWNDFVVNVIFSGTVAEPNLQNGKLIAWINGVQVVNRTNVQTYFGEQTQGPYLKWGLYQWSWQPSNIANNELNVNEPASRTLYHDGIRIGNASSSYAEVMP